MIFFKNKKKITSCGEPHEKIETGLKKIVLVGNPNVGKSVMFNDLTGAYAVVSNYPGTTVEVYRGRSKINNINYEVIDTPGMYSLYSITEEEKVARDIIFYEKPHCILHVVDAKNLYRMLPLTLQLIETNLPVVLVLNMTDELEKVNKKINIDELKNKLNISVVQTIGTTKKGIQELKNAITNIENFNTNKIVCNYNDDIENALTKINNLYNNGINKPNKALSQLLLFNDQDIVDKMICNDEDKNKLLSIINETKKNNGNSLDYVFSLKRAHITEDILKNVFITGKIKKFDLRNFLSGITMNPITGIPILFLVTYLGLYKFVGEFGAGILVDFLEGVIFEKYINPFFVYIINSIIPWSIIKDLFVGEYGILTLGLRYSFGIILPIVTVFFFVFAIIEDTGYLPRLAMLVDKIFKKIGLSGRAVIPMVLGLGCDTMATVVTRTLPTKRERLLATILLSLTIPCSAQLGVILAIFEGNNPALFIWGLVIALVFLLVGFLSSKFLPGEKPVFYMEIPPLRLPKLSNVIVKTITRVQWYLKEILPVFLIASFLIWLGKITRIFDLMLFVLKYPVKLLGLPEAASKIFLFGFFRRDYGAAGLYDLKKTGAIDTIQLIVASIALTLFLPCVAQFVITIKERGIKTGIGISVFILFFSFIISFIVNFILRSIGVVL